MGQTKSIWLLLVFVILLLGMSIGCQSSSPLPAPDSSSSPSPLSSPVSPLPSEIRGITSDTATEVMLLQTWKTPGWWVDHFAFLPDKNQLLLSYGQYNDSTIGVMHLNDGRVERITHEGKPIIISSLAVGAGGRIAATGSRGPFVQVWALPDVTLLHSLEVPGMFASVAIAPDEQTLATSPHAPLVTLWNIPQATPLITIEGLAAPATTLLFSPNGQHLATGLSNGSTQLWDVASGALLHTLMADVADTTAIEAISFSPDNQILAMASTRISLWNSREGTLLRSLVHGSDLVKAIAFSPDGSILVAGKADGSIDLWSVSDGIFLHTLRGHEPGAWEGSIAPPWVNHVIFSPDGRQMISGGNDGTVRVWGIP